MTTCMECHHAPSGRYTAGLQCYCPCHDVADASPKLLKACRIALRRHKKALDIRIRLTEVTLTEEIAILEEAIGAAEGRTL